MANLILIVLLVTFLIYLRIFLLEKSVATKLLVLNSINAIGITIITLLAFFLKQRFFIDVAILYALIGFIANAAFLKLRERRNGDH